VVAVKPTYKLPKLPVARVLWKPLPDMPTACAAWILAGGAHHTAYSQNLQTEHLENFAEMAGIEMVVINRDTKIREFKNQLRLNEIVYK
jgi:L-arabinose isomerase